MTRSLYYTHEALTSLAPHKSLPELPVIPREKPHTGAAAQENPRDAPVFATCRPSFLAWPGEQSRVLSPNSTVGLTPFWSLSGLQDIPVAIREENGVFCFPSRRGLTPRVSLVTNRRSLSPLERNIRSWTQAWMRSLFSCSDSRSIPNSPSQLEWKIGLPWVNRRGSLNFPL